MHCDARFLMVEISQWHQVLIFRCYDFDSGEIREAARLDPETDAALIEDFKVRNETMVLFHLQKLRALSPGIF